MSKAIIGLADDSTRARGDAARERLAKMPPIDPVAWLAQCKMPKKKRREMEAMVARDVARRAAREESTHEQG